MFKRKKASPSDNPWTKIEHNHEWLSANEGKELVCGLCGERKDA